MPDPTIAIAVVALIALVEATPAVRIPTGMLLAIALLASGAELLAIALLGAVGVMIARLSLALAARSGRDHIRRPSPAAQAQRDALRAHLSRSPAYARTTFVLAALPGVPAGFVFPLLGAMRAPLWPALAGTVVGRVPVLAITAAFFTWVGRLLADSDDQAAIALAFIAIAMFAVRMISDIDWQHRAETGEWRIRSSADPMTRMTMMFGEGGARRPDQQNPWGQANGGSSSSHFSADDSDIVEGELLGEEVDGDDDDPGSGSDDDPPAALPPSGAAPA